LALTPSLGFPFERIYWEDLMADEILGEDKLLRSIDEVDERLKDFRKKVKSVLDDLQSSEKVPESKDVI
jgi:hypothetical protein